MPPQQLVSGYVHVEGRSAAEVDNRMRRILAAFRIEINTTTATGEADRTEGGRAA